MLAVNAFAIALVAALAVQNIHEVCHGLAALLLIPYIAINLLFTVLSFWHPLGAEGIFLTLSQYWGGYAGFIWAFLLAAYWLKINAPLSRVTALPNRISLAWVILAAVAFGVAVAVLLPSINLS